MSDSLQRPVTDESFCRQMDSLSQQLNALRSRVANSGRGGGSLNPTSVVKTPTPRSMGQRSLRPMHSSPSLSSSGKTKSPLDKQAKPSRHTDDSSIWEQSPSNNRQSDYKTTLSPTSQSRTAGTHNHPLLAVLLPSSELDPPTIPSPRHQTTRHKPAPYTPSLDRHPDTSFRSDWSDIRAEDSVSCREIGQLFKNNEEKEEEGDDGILKLLECVHLALGDESVQQSRGTEGYGQSGKILNDSMGATPQYHAATKHPASRESTPRHGSSLDTNLSRPTLRDQSNKERTMYAKLPQMMNIPRIEYESLVMDNDDTFLERVIAPVMAKYVPPSTLHSRSNPGTFLYDNTSMSHILPSKYHTAK